MSVLPFVSVVVPCWNEAPFVAEFLDSVMKQTYPADRLEILLVDGMSDDGTRDVVRRYAVRHPSLRMLDNPGHRKPEALNLGIREAKGEFIIRLDVHAFYEDDYLRKCVSALRDHPEADNVGGIRKSLPRKDTLLGRALALATTHPLAAGNAKYRVGASKPQWVDTVFGGCWRREVFDRIGYFDEKLTRAQDREFNQRLRASGGRILLIPDIVCTYYARSGWRDYGSWIFEAGYWPFRASRLVGRWIGGWRNFVPVAFVAGSTAGLALAPRSVVLRRLTGAGLLTYGSAVLAASAHLAWRKRDPGLLAAMPVAFVLTHTVYGVGSVWGIVSPLPAPVVEDAPLTEGDVRIGDGPLTRRQIATIARMHRDGVTEGFLSTLGEPALRLLYRHVATSRHCKVFVALAPDGETVGYIAGCRDTSALFREFALRRWASAARVLLPRLLSPARIRRAAETLRYPSAAPAGLPKAEVINIVVQPAWRGRGIAEQLLSRLMDWFAEQGDTAVKAVSGDQLTRAHRFYEKSGARLEGHTSVHRGVGSRVYVYSVDRS
jgi:glycosyltransferase involved in cell wall biosynthesis/GNAT superfamily N-acetyltransferase